MSKCDLAIVFDRADRVYLPGETVSGHVEVEVNKDVKCKALRIEMRWQTHGKGNTDFEIMDQTEEPGMEWTAGSVHRFPFRFKAPKMPLTYHGHILNIDHYVRATADIPWAIDPKAAEEFILEPGESTERDYREGREEPAVAKKKVGLLGKGCGWVIGLLVIGLLLFFLLAFWFVFVIIGLIVGAIALNKYMVRKKLGEIRFEVRDVTVVSGGVARIRVGIAPAKPIHINAITLTTTATEVCVSGSGTRKTTHTNELHAQQTVLASDYRAPGSGIPVEFKHDIRIPDLGAYTFKSKDNSIRWKVAFHVDIPNYPDHNDSLDLNVIPAAKHRET